MLRNLRLQTGSLRRGLALAILVLSALLLLHGGPPAAWGSNHRIVPTVPQNVEVTRGDASLTLTWEAPSAWGSFPAGGYDVEWYAGATPPTDPEDWERATLTASPLAATATSYTFTGTYGSHTVANGRTYQLRFRAFSKNPNDEGDILPSFWVVASGTPAVPSANATLSGLDLANAATGSDAPVGLNAPFSNDYSYYVALLLKEVTSITVEPTATAGSLSTITVQLETGGTPETVASGAVSSAIAITPKADSTVPHNIIVNVTAENGSDTKTYTVRVFQFDPVSFGGVTVPDMHFTAGHETERGPLPAETTDLYDVTYTATGLPAGLYLGPSRRILGTPEAADSNPVSVTYTAEGSIGSSASLTFQATVAPPVAFDLADFDNSRRIRIEYTIGQTERINVTLPEATGGRGVLTYRLVYLVDEGSGNVEKSINDDAPGFSFDPATRVLTSDTGASAPSAAVFYSADYWAVDENGARAYGRVSIDVNEAPSLPEIEDRSLTVGVEASITLPEATGGTLREESDLFYELEPSEDGRLSPDLEGLSFNAGSRVISGSPTLPGSTDVTYTATDTNGVSDSKTFTITVVNGPTAPTAAPASLVFSRSSIGSGVIWAPVTGAVSYVVQVIADGGSYPDKPYNFAPAGTAVSFGGTATQKWVVLIGFSAGDYKMRVAARNEDGVGPWSSEVSFTLRVGGI